MSVLNILIKPPHVRNNLSKINKLALSRTFAKKCAQAGPLRVAVCGAGGKVGQPLSLMLKQSPYIDHLAVYDSNGVCGFAKDLGHVDTRCKVSGHSGIDSLSDALGGAQIVVVVAGAQKTSNLAFSAMFEANACIVREITENFALYCPKAFLVIATNPVNSLVPLASKILIQNGAYDSRAVFGVTNLNVVRTNTFVAEVLGLEPQNVAVPVIGGNSGLTIIPLLSQARPCNDFTLQELEDITKHVQAAHHEIIKVKLKESGSLACAFSIARFVLSLVEAFKGRRNIVECAFAKTNVYSSVSYLAAPVLLGKSGISLHLGLPKLSDYENCQLENAVPILNDDIKKGELFAGGSMASPPCDPCDPRQDAPICPPNPCFKPHT